MTIGQRITMCRKALGLTEGEIALACGWDDPSTLNHYVNGRRQPPLKSVLSIAKVLKCTPGWLAFNEGYPPNYLSISFQQPGSFCFLSWEEFVEKSKNNEKFTAESFFTLNDLNSNSFVINVRHESIISINARKITIIPGDLLIVDPENKILEHENCYLIGEKDWKEPCIAQYIEMGNKKYFKIIYDQERIEFSKNIMVFGVIVLKVSYLI